MGALTKHDIVQKLHHDIGIGRKEGALLVDSIFNLMKETLSKGEKIKISGFGKFSIRDKKLRRGRNPKTGENLKLPERRVLTFRPSQLLRDDLFSKYGHRLKEDGSEDTAIPAKEGTSKALSSFLANDEDEEGDDGKGEA